MKTASIKPIQILHDYPNASHMLRVRALMRPTAELGECWGDVWTAAWEASSHNLHWQHYKGLLFQPVPARHGTAWRDRIWLKRETEERTGAESGSKMDAPHNDSIPAVISQQLPRECFCLTVKGGGGGVCVCVCVCVWVCVCVSGCLCEC